MRGMRIGYLYSTGQSLVRIFDRLNIDLLFTTSRTLQIPNDQKRRDGPLMASTIFKRCQPDNLGCKGSCGSPRLHPSGSSEDVTDFLWGHVKNWLFSPRRAQELQES